ncbi:diguanylate cyclase [Dyella sp. 2HG41-7]|uniref:GGDEF domain-containing protein n=1 Tax=Dyella sp. 2HG41-7 TaxID=2883239 RepID=UPI001F22861E|nr:diguanylate cyclase [Dyella sp. 2HG41-7]
MIPLLALGFIVLHTISILLLPGHAVAASYAFLVAAPLLASVSALRSGLKFGLRLTQGWSLVALSMLSWTAGMLCSLCQDLFFHNFNIAPGATMLLYTLYGVPIFYAVATVGVESSSYLQRGIDAILAALLGYLYFALMFSWTTLQGVSSHQSAEMIAFMFDMENAFLTAMTATRFFAANAPNQRRLFGALASFTCVYGITAAYYNHHIALDIAPDFGTVYDVIIDVPFLVFILFVLQIRQQAASAPNPPDSLVRFVRIGSPLLLALSVLTIALMIMVLHQRFVLGVVGIVTAVVGYGLRSILSQVQQIEVADKLRSDQSMLAEMALIDSLTGIPNRRAFEEAIEREWRLALRTQQVISLLLIDVDMFKQYNDRYGHIAGDVCLRKVADTLAQAIHRPTDLLARYGGEEFVLILPSTPTAGAIDVAESLCASINYINLPQEDNPVKHITISIGIASMLPTNDALPSELIRAADHALYDAKRKGRNRFEVAT